MKTWEVTTRGADGKPEVITISAETRQEVFAELAKMGTKAIRIEEATGKKPRKASSGGAPSKGRGLIAAAIVILGVGAAVWFLMPKTEKPVEVKKDPKKQIKAEPVKPVKAKPVKKEEVKEEKPVDNEIARRREMLKKMTPEERLDYLFERAKERPLPQEPSSNRIYRTSLEQVMDWVFSCEVGNPPPLLPQMSMFDEAHLAEILLMDNPVKDTDSDKVRASKEMMKIAKKEFIDFIKKGGDPHEFLPYYHGQLVQAHEEWKMARQSIVETVKNEPDIAVEYIKKVNAQLEEKGIKKVTVPPKMLERFGIQAEEL